MRYVLVLLGVLVTLSILWSFVGSVELQGTVIRKPWTKSYESWNAGGSEYYVLDVGDVRIPERSAREGVILRPTDAVPFQAFQKFKGTRVTVRGRFIEGEPFIPPEDSLEQYPISGDPNEPVLRGSGFEVYEIDPVSSQHAD